MVVTAAMVKELREATGVGMMDCKKALTEADGDMEVATKLLREKGLAAAAKKAGRIAAEGLSHVYINNDGVGVIVEVNSETDFVAKNAEFQEYVQNVAVQATNSSNEADMEAFYAENWHLDNSITVRDALSQMVAKIGENLTIRRFKKLVKGANGTLVSYIHSGGKVAVIIELNSEVSNDALAEAGRNLCMQIASMNPQFVTRDQVSEEFIKNEKEILVQQAMNDEKNAGKPQNILEKMVEGRLTKNLREMCLCEQEYVKDGDMSVKQYIDSVSKAVGNTVSVERFVRFETGEGIAKREENFADEVNKAMGIE